MRPTAELRVGGRVLVRVSSSPLKTRSAPYMLSSGSSAWRLQSSPLNPPQVVYQGLWKYTDAARDAVSGLLTMLSKPSSEGLVRRISSFRSTAYQLAHGSGSPNACCVQEGSKMRVYGRRYIMDGILQVEGLGLGLG